MPTIRDIFTAYAPEYIERYPNLPHAARPLTLSAAVVQGHTAIASMPANTADNTTASIMPAAIGIVPGVNTTKPNCGCTTNSRCSCPDPTS